MEINSSNIRTVSYNSKTRELTMTFVKRPTWVYVFQNVPRSIWDRFLRASSQGVFFSKNIRDKYNYKFRKV